MTQTMMGSCTTAAVLLFLTITSHLSSAAPAASSPFSTPAATESPDPRHGGTTTPPHKTVPWTECETEDPNRDNYTTGYCTGYGDGYDMAFFLECENSSVPVYVMTREPPRGQEEEDGGQQTGPRDLTDPGNNYGDDCEDDCEDDGEEDCSEYPPESSEAGECFGFDDGYNDGSDDCAAGRPRKVPPLDVDDEEDNSPYTPRNLAKPERESATTTIPKTVTGG